MKGCIQLAQLMGTANPERIMQEIIHIGSLTNPLFDIDQFTGTYLDIQRLFQGDFPGYRACNTQYHDFAHTYCTTLAMSRLMHGASLSGIPFSRFDVQIGLTAALMHDTGYIQEIDDRAGTGAKYTMTHIGRSIIFLAWYCSERNCCGGGNIKDFSDILRCTGLSTKISDLDFSSPLVASLGKMMGTADLLGQMADRLYLEKLPFLYREFEEGGLDQFMSEYDLLLKTIEFYHVTQQRLAGEFGGVNEYMLPHFRKRWGIDCDLYQESIRKNIEYLKRVLDDGPGNLTDWLKRST
jgi:hypothetical protein